MDENEAKLEALKAMIKDCHDRNEARLLKQLQQTILSKQPIKDNGKKNGND